MRQRLIGAAVLVPVVVIVFLLGDPWLTMALAALAGLAAYETVQLVRGAGLLATSSLAIGTAVLAVGLTRLVLGPIEVGGIVVAPFQDELVVPLVLGLVALAFGVGGFLGMRKRDPAEGFRSWTGNTFAALYPSLIAFVAGILAVAPALAPGSALANVLDGGRAWVLILVATVWTFDSFAFLAGKFHGRGRFMNHISPKKTWSGVVGGTTAAIVVCALLVSIAGQHWLAGALLGLVIAISAQAGDLAESMLKRAAGAKDSGNLLPGHGGILDRVDSFLFAAPAMFIGLTWIQFLTTTRPT